jgi:hypothetical protein
MGREGMEFGSAEPTLIYVAIRWNDSKAIPKDQKKFVKEVAEKLHWDAKKLKIYNLCRPSKARGMTLSLEEYPQVVDSINRIARHRRSIRRIIVGGRTGPMPFVARFLKLLLPRTRVEIRNHHRARMVNGGPFGGRPRVLKRCYD